MSSLLQVEWELMLVWHLRRHRSRIWGGHGSSVRWRALEQLLVADLFLLVVSLGQIVPCRLSVERGPQSSILLPCAVACLRLLDRHDVAKGEAFLEVDCLDLALDHWASDWCRATLPLDIVHC